MEQAVVLGDCELYGLEISEGKLALPTLSRVFNRDSSGADLAGVQYGADTARFATVGSRTGLLIEGATTNRCTYSQALENWNKTRATVSADVATAPDGTSTAVPLSPSRYSTPLVRSFSTTAPASSGERPV